MKNNESTKLLFIPFYDWLRDEEAIDFRILPEDVFVFYRAISALVKALYEINDIESSEIDAIKVIINDISEAYFENSEMSDSFLETLKTRFVSYDEFGEISSQGLLLFKHDGISTLFRNTNFFLDTNNVEFKLENLSKVPPIINKRLISIKNAYFNSRNFWQKRVTADLAFSDKKLFIINSKGRFRLRRNLFGLVYFLHFSGKVLEKKIIDGEIHYQDIGYLMIGIIRSTAYEVALKLAKQKFDEIRKISPKDIISCKTNNITTKAVLKNELCNFSKHTENPIVLAISDVEKFWNNIPKTDPWKKGGRPPKITREEIEEETEV